MIEFSIVTPDGVQYKKECFQVDLPGEIGVFGVLYAHTNMVSALKIGRVDIIEQEGQGFSKSFFVSSGFAEVNPTKCVVIVERADDLSEISVSSVEEQIKELSKDSVTEEGHDDELRDYLDGLLATLKG